MIKTFYIIRKKIKNEIRRLKAIGNGLNTIRLLAWLIILFWINRADKKDIKRLIKILKRQCKNLLELFK